VQLDTVKGALRLTIEDNACGFMRTDTDASHGLGLTIMRDRARAAGAELAFEKLAGGGTRVLCKCPLSAAARMPNACSLPAREATS
jgi:signal transduction histidine kinase